MRRAPAGARSVLRRVPDPTHRAELGSRRLSVLRGAARLRRPDRRRPASARVSRVRGRLGVSTTPLSVLRYAVLQRPRSPRGGGEGGRLLRLCLQAVQSLRQGARPADSLERRLGAYRGLGLASLRRGRHPRGLLAPHRLADSPRPPRLTGGATNQHRECGKLSLHLPFFNAMYPTLFDLAIFGYIAATGLSLDYLVQLEEWLHRLASVATIAGWVLHAVALLALAFRLGRPPLGSLSEAMSVAVWVAVLWALWVERQYGVKVLGAFVMPVVLVFSLNSATTRSLGIPGIERALGGAWIWVHIGLVLVGIAAFVLNFAGALMYVLQERQLKAKRPGALYYRLPDLETLDRLTYRTLALGFPFLTTGLILGVLWAGRAWGSVFAYDPLALLSFVAWAIYAGTLAGRAAAGWRGRRAAYFAIIGFATLVLTLSAGLFLPGRHGS